MSWRPPDGMKYLRDMPVGMKHLAVDASFVRERTGYSASYSLEQGLQETSNWYCETRSPTEVAENLTPLLTQR